MNSKTDFKRLYFIFSLIFLALIIYQRILWISEFHVLPTTDGYFYLQEFRSLMRDGQSYYHTRSFFYSIAAGIGQLFHFSELTLYHFLVALSLVLYGSALFMFLPGAAMWLGPAVLSLLFLSDALFPRYYAFLRQAFSWSLFLFCFASLYRCKFTERKLLHLSAMFVALLAMLMHLFTMVSGAFMLITLYIKRMWLQGLALLVLGGLSVYLGHEQGKEIINLQSHGFMPTWVGVCKYLHMAAFEYVEFGLYTALALIVIAITLLSHNYHQLPLYLGSFAIFLILPVWSKAGGMDIRLSFGFVWIMLPALCCFTEKFYKPGKVLILIAFVILGTGYCLLPRTPYPVKSKASPILPAYRTELEIWIPKGSFVLAPQGINFAFTYYLGLPSAKQMPNESVYPEVFMLVKRKKYMFADRCAPVSSLSADNAAQIHCVTFKEGWILKRQQ